MAVFGRISKEEYKKRKWYGQAVERCGYPHHMGNKGIRKRNVFNGMRYYTDYNKIEDFRFKQFMKSRRKKRKR